MYPHSAQSKSKQSSQRNSQPPTRNDGGTGKVIRGTHIVMLFFGVGFFVCGIMGRFRKIIGDING